MATNSRAELSVDVFWGPRAESPTEVADRVGRMLSRLREIDPEFVVWYRTARRKRQAYHPFPSDPAAIELLLERSEPQLGYEPFGCWNGSESCASTFKVRVGHTHPVIPNNVGIGLPPVRPDGGLWEANSLSELLRTLVEVWEPWTGRVSVRALQDVQLDEYWADDKRADMRDHPFLGWLTYFDKNAVTKRPSGSREFEQGWLLQLGDRPEDATIGMVHTARRRLKYRRPWATETE